MPKEEVNKALLSVSRIVKSGNRVVFDSDGSYIEHKESGEIEPLEKRGGVYTHSASGAYNITLYTAELKRFHYVAYKDEDEANKEFERVIGNKDIIDNIIYRWQQKKRNRGTKKTKKR